MNLVVLAGILGVVMMFTGLLVKQLRVVSGIAAAGLCVLFISNLWELYHAPFFTLPESSMLATTRFGLLINQILLLAGILYVVLFGRHIQVVGKHVADYYALIFFVYAGIGISTSYTNLLMLFLGIEIMSIPLYILTGSDKRNLKSNEAALKYFLMGSFSTGIMLMGIALIYGATGSFNVASMNTQLSFNLIVGILLLLISMSFKVSAAPFHFWTPDVYDGAPTAFTAFMATIVKVAAFAAFIHLFEGSFEMLNRKWQLLIAIIIACTLLVGNITAVFQQSVKRMLAYSSIAQAGFMMFALFAFNDASREGIVLYGAAYCLATLGLFAVLIKMEDYTFDGFNGLAKSQPLLAGVSTVFLLSLAGIPLTLGFFSKYYMVSAALSTGGKYLWLFVLAMLCAAISVYYYFRVIQAMYFKPLGGVPGTSTSLTTSTTRAFNYTLLVMALLVILLGLQPQLLLQFLYF
ncbi:MAG: NADH-quinone oxidoreductase subunit N [Bacteroidetes bacterium]|nr:MAG: NADH-quinone oxidoreductase subunit N [Bacteroidota bacterium]